MSYRQNIIETFANAYKPLSVQSYLRAKGWTKRDESHVHKVAFWDLKLSDGDVELLVPLDKSFRDLLPRVREMVETIWIAEQKRPIDQLVEDILMPNMDILRTRLNIDEKDMGTLPIEAGVAAFTKVRELLLAGACAAVDPKPLYSKRKADTAMQYLNDARFGQTGRGSYIITVYSPVPPVIIPNQLSMIEHEEFGISEDENEPFQRKVVRVLNEALNSALDGTQSFASSGTIDLDEIYKQGVSANLCEAIVGLNDKTNDNGVEFNFSWAATQKAPENSNDLIQFSSETKPYLSEISSHYRKIARHDDISVFGQVHKLERIGKPEDNRGKVTIIGIIDGEKKTVTTELEGEQHSLAVKAYEEKLPLECGGDLIKEGGGYKLKNLKDFKVLE